MANEEFDRPIYKLIAVVILSVLAGITGIAGLGNLAPGAVQSVARPDPWTGTDARNSHKELKAEMKQHIHDEINRVNARLGRLESQLNIHERSAEKWKFQIQSNKDRMDYHFKNHP